MNLAACLRLCLASAAFMLTLPAGATGHKPGAKGKPLAASRRPAAKPVVPKLMVPKPAPTSSVLAAPEAPAAPQTVVLTGVVLLPSGKPCPGAAVFMPSAPRQLVVTDQQGAFALPVPAGGPVAVQADYYGVGSSHTALDKPGPQPLRLTLR